MDYISYNCSVERKLLITKSGALVEYHEDTDPKTFKKINKHFTGIIQIEFISSGDFSGLDVEKLTDLINVYFASKRDITLYDFIRSVN